MTEVVRRAHLTDELVSQLPLPLQGEARVWDTDVVGFCIRLHPSGRRTFCLKCRMAGRPVWKTIGVFRAPWSTTHARDAAAEILTGSGAQHAVSSTLESTASRDSTVAALIDVYLEDGPATALAKRASSWRIDASNLRRHVAPLLGHRLVAGLTQDDVARMCLAIRDGKTAITVRTGKRGIARVRGGPGAAAITFRIFKAMIEWAIRRRMVSYNPAKGLRLPRPATKERILTRDEARLLFSLIDQGQHSGRLNSAHGDILKLLMLTGARRMEIMGLRWAEVDLPRARLVLPPERSKTGSRTGERRIALGESALAILAARERTGAYVFPAGRGGRGHTTGIQKSWEKIRAQAGLQGMRIHDLRHSFASFALESGENILTISAALGHASTQMTERYLHLQRGATEALATRTSAYILA